MSALWLLLPSGIALALVIVEACAIGPSVGEVVERALGPDDETRTTR